METKKKRQIAILGSTGSIGTQTLQVVEEHPECFEVYAITANSRVDDLIAQARKFMPEAVVIADETKYEELKEALSDLPIKVYAGYEAICQIVESGPIDVVVTAMVGFSGLRPTINAIKAGKAIALANKETMVVAGEMINALAMEYKTPILPVDSEHSAIFQCLAGEMSNRIEKLILTASGGPFRTWNREDIAKATRAQALNHPNWSMGSKITIDSATMMNKGLEIIEARWLFGTPGDKIQVVIHPESIIHSMVEYADGSVIAQMGHPDMREAIQFAFSYPYRLPLDNRKLNFAELGSMSFFAPDAEKFPALGLAYESLEKGGNMACIMNAANEAAVAAFLQEKIGFYDITDIVHECMSGADFVADPDLETIFKTNETVLAKAAELIGKVSCRKTF